MPTDAIVLASVPIDLPRYTEPRPSKLSTAHIDALLSAVAAGRTLREVGAEFGISPERARQIVREYARESIAAD